MDLTRYILQGFSFLPKKTATINGTDYDVLFNQSTHRHENIVGGFLSDQEATIYIETALLDDPKSLRGKYLTMDNEQWRIVSVRYGDYVTHLTIVSPNAL